MTRQKQTPIDNLTRRLRGLLDELDRLLRPMPKPVRVPVPIPIPVRRQRPNDYRYR
ncbi:MAG: hypothetical protein SGI73_20775 [Chloroflexota bacterium]|nr:hypothetical protein [Chloroflexota bacterium]